MLPRAVTEFESVPPRLLCRVHSNVGRAPSRISLERGVPLEEGGVPIAKPPQRRPGYRSSGCLDATSGPRANPITPPVLRYSAANHSY
jgi:hypothetical protein